MIVEKEFDELWGYLLANPWGFLDKENLPATKTLYYNNLKDYEYKEVWKVFDEFIHSGDIRKLPLVQSVLSALQKNKDLSNYNPTKLNKDKKLRRLFSRMLRETKYIMADHANNKGKLEACGNKYQKLKRMYNEKQIIRLDGDDRRMTKKRPDKKASNQDDETHKETMMNNVLSLNLQKENTLCLTPLFYILITFKLAIA